MSSSRLQRLCFALIVGGAVTSPLPAKQTSQTRNDCEPGIRPAPGSAAYHQVEDRCEGAYEVNKSSQLLNIESLHFVADAAAANDCSTSTVRFVEEPQPVDIHVRRLTGNAYRMDTHGQPGKQGVYRWPCHILKSAGPIQEVGVLVKLSDGSFYLPAALSLGDAAPPTHRLQVIITSLSAATPTGQLEAIQSNGATTLLPPVSFKPIPREGAAKRQWATEFEVPSSGQFELDVKVGSAEQNLRVPFLVAK
jgi:hypothetical protein